MIYLSSGFLSYWGCLDPIWSFTLKAYPAWDELLSCFACPRVNLPPCDVCDFLINHRPLRPLGVMEWEGNPTRIASMIQFKASRDENVWCHDMHTHTCMYIKYYMINMYTYSMYIWLYIYIYIHPMVSFHPTPPEMRDQKDFKKQIVWCAEDAVKKVPTLSSNAKNNPQVHSKNWSTSKHHRVSPFKIL